MEREVEDRPTERLKARSQGDQDSKETAEPETLVRASGGEEFSAPAGQASGSLEDQTAPTRRLDSGPSPSSSSQPVTSQLGTGQTDSGDPATGGGKTDPILRVGQFGKYRIVGKIGAGGFGKVYLGHDPVLGRDVAVKTCTSDDERLRRRFLHEAKIAAGLQHPNIVTVYDFGYEGEVPFMVQEYLSGEDLTRKIERRDLPWELRIEYLVSIASGLAHAHDHGVLHRDIKPANIRVLDDGQVRILDFGIARLLDQTTAFTTDGVAMGTVGYLAPELLNSDEVDERSDIFSFGVLAYEMLCYQRPFLGDTFLRVSYRLLHEDAPPLADLAPECPPVLVEIVEKCLHKSPIDRFASFQEILVELARLIEDSQGALATLPPASGSRPMTLPPSATPRSSSASLEPPVAAPSSSPGSSQPAPHSKQASGSQQATESSAPVTAPTIVVEELRAGKHPGRRWAQVAVIAMAVVLLGVFAWSRTRTGQVDSGVESRGEEGLRAEISEDKDLPASAPVAERNPEASRSAGPGPEVAESPAPPSTQSSRPATSSPAATGPEATGSAAASEPAFASNQDPGSEASGDQTADLPATELKRPDVSQSADVSQSEDASADFEAPPIASSSRAGSDDSRVAVDADPGVRSADLGSDSSETPSSDPGSEQVSPSLEDSQVADAPEPGSQAAGQQLAVEEPKESTPEAPTSNIDSGSQSSTKSGDFTESLPPPPGIKSLPKLIDKVQPQYPPRARRRRQEATVNVGVRVDAYGKVVRTLMRSSTVQGMGFEEAALEAARQSTFEPGTEDGSPVAMWTQIEFKFKRAN